MTDSDKVLLYKFGSMGPSESFSPMVTLKGFEKIEGKDNLRFHELMNELKNECLKLKINFQGRLYHIEPEWKTKHTLPKKTPLLCRLSLHKWERDKKSETRYNRTCVNCKKNMHRVMEANGYVYWVDGLYK